MTENQDGSRPAAEDAAAEITDQHRGDDITDEGLDAYWAWLVTPSDNGGRMTPEAADYFLRWSARYIDPEGRLSPEELECRLQMGRYILCDWPGWVPSEGER